jgi:hypothetical protein
MTHIPQFIMALNIVEDFLRGEGYKYFRLVPISIFSYFQRQYQPFLGREY